MAYLDPRDIGNGGGRNPFIAAGGLVGLLVVMKYADDLPGYWALAGLWSGLVIGGALGKCVEFLWIKTRDQAAAALERRD